VTAACAVIRHESAELGRMERVERGPAPHLQGIVHRYCGYRHEGTAGTRRLEVAQDQVTVILGFGPPLRVGGPTRPAADEHSFVAALHDSYAITQEYGALAGIQVDLSPLGAYMLFGVSMHELSAQLVVGLEDVLGRGGAELVERLEGLDAWEARLTALDEYVTRRVERARQPAPDAVWAWRRLRDSGGRATVAELTRELGCSPRHLVTRFREQIGPPPKTAARLVRFQRAVALLGRDDGRRFAEIAQLCGYYDQAHMNRDFRELAGASPGAFVARLLPDGLGVAAP
jgi:AraC-like DNA-binding protein